MSRASAWAVGVGLYTALSAADFLQTYALIEGGTGHEANPVAAGWLRDYGWAGLAAFKAAMTMTVFGSVLLLARRRPPVAARVLGLGCGVLLAVGVYSRGLLTAEAAEDEFLAAVGTGGIVEVVPGDPRWASGGPPGAIGVRL
jgi:hypothetical protein